MKKIFGLILSAAVLGTVLTACGGSGAGVSSSGAAGASEPASVSGSAVNSSVSAKEDLANYNIGIQAGSAALEAVTNDAVYASIQDKITEYPTYDEVILDVQAGRLDCMIIDEVYGGYKNAKLGSIFAVSEVDFGDDLYAIGFRKGDAELTQAVNDAINALIESGKAAEISEAWFGADIVVKG